MPRFPVRKADALSFLRGMRARSAQLVLTSPPYANRRRNTYGGVSPEEYVEWFLPIAEQARRVLRDDGVLALNIKFVRNLDGSVNPYAFRLVLAIIERVMPMWESADWIKGTTEGVLLGEHVRAMGGAGKSCYLRDCIEQFYFFARHRRYFRNEMKIPIGEWARHRRRGTPGRTNSSTGSGYGCDRVKAARRRTARSSNVFRSGAIVATTSAKSYGHSAAFSTCLVEPIIRYLTSEGDMIVDPFAGSGTTIEAALALGRRAIGCDKDGASIRSARRRMRAAGKSKNAVFKSS